MTDINKQTPMPISEIEKSEHPQHFAMAGETVNFRDSWRIFRIISEFIDGYQFLSKFKKEVTILGSARLPRSSHYYKIAEELGYMLGKNGFTTITGGGPSIMEAANKGAYEAGGQSVGINIQLPFEQRINAYVKESVGFFYFFTRKVMLTSPADAFVFFPGGFGTMDEFFEVVDFIDLGLMQKAPVILVDKEFWEPLLKFLKQNSSGIARSFPIEIIDSWHVVDTAQEAFEFIKDTKDIEEQCDLKNESSIYCQGGADWRVFRIMAELVDGFEFLANIKNDVTVFGTKSILPGSPYYNLAYETGKLLAKNGFTTITGGGPGIMEAANKGAFENGGVSVGINMRWNKGERVNNFVTKSAGFFFPFVRKLIITAPSEAFVFFPGGFGTLHQLFEILTLQETKKSPIVPIILVGSDFWKPIVDYFYAMAHDFKTISPSDQYLVKIVDRPEDILQYLK